MEYVTYSCGKCSFLSTDVFVGLYVVALLAKQIDGG